MRDREAVARFFEAVVWQDPRPYAARAASAQRAVAALLASVGNPHLGLQVIHVAGSKGKGSTALLTEAILRAAGLRVGTFTSPHLTWWGERFRIDGRDAADDLLATALAALRPAVMRACAAGEPPGFFDVATAAALWLFSQVGVDVAVVEVGLGGTLDATNIVSPRVSCITSIEHEHVDKLGDTLALIAAHKAGIIKPGVPVVLGALPAEAASVAMARAVELGAPLWRLGDALQVAISDEPESRGRVADRHAAPAAAHPPGMRLHLRLDHGRGHAGAPSGMAEGMEGVEEIHDVVLPLVGRHLAHNAALAFACVACSGLLGRVALAAAVRHGFADVCLPGRVEIVARQPWVIVDGAHTSASAAALVDVLERLPHRRRLLVLSASSGKDLPALLVPLLPGAAFVVATCADATRSLPAEAVAEAVVRLRPDLECRCVASPAAALHAALAEAAPQDMVCVTGSVYVAGAVRAAFSGMR